MMRKAQLLSVSCLQEEPNSALKSGIRRKGQGFAFWGVA